MGTRGACGFRQGNRDMIWGRHYDSYPAGLGVRVLNQLKHYLKKKPITHLRDKLARIDIVDNTQFRHGPSFVIEGNVMWRPFDDTTMMEHGSLDPFLYGAMSKVVNYGSFLKESLFCEWAYVVNLDSEKFEIWIGYQKKPDDNNRYGDKVSDEFSGDRYYPGSKYYPCKLIIEYDLNKLPSASKLEKDCYEISNNKEV